jgi:hypothetical protein
VVDTITINLTAAEEGRKILPDMDTHLIKMEE